MTTAKILDGSVTKPKLGALSVTNSKVGTGAIDARALAALSVSGPSVATGAIGTAKLGAAAATRSKVAALAVSTTKVMTAAITNDKIATGVIGLGGGTHKTKLGKLNANVVSVSFTATGANTAASHGLGRVPVFILQSVDQASDGIVYDGTTAHTTTLLNLRYTKGTNAVKVVAF
jgi:hypothetical protein